MLMLFENRITQAGRQAIQDLIDYVFQNLERTMVDHGENSPEAAQSLLVLLSIEQIMEPSEEAHARVHRYLAISEEIYGRHSLEFGNGSFLLGWSHMVLGERKREDWPLNSRYVFPVASATGFQSTQC